MELMMTYEGEPASAAIKFLPQESEEKGTFLSVRQEVSEDGRLVFLAGLGKEEELTRLRVKRVAAASVKAALADGCESILLDLTEACRGQGEKSFVNKYLAAFLEGALMAQYKVKSYKKEAKKRRTVKLYLKLLGESGAMGLHPGIEERIAALLKEQSILAGGVAFARDLVNQPGNLLTPEIMAGIMKQKAEKLGLEVQVYSRDQIKELGMEGFLAVGDSSGNPPKLTVVRYQGNRDDERIIGLIGKGVTCDTGGYSLKPANSMAGIRGDMAGGAAVFSAITALAEMKAKVNAVVVIPAAENRISDQSYLPGDVIRSMSGKTIEIGNTDAEGRLLLADAVTYAIEKEKVTHLVDVATLTGAVVNMLGFTTAGLLTNSEELYQTFEKAAALTAEQYWRLPAHSEYREMINCRAADLQNISDGGCGTITAGLFVGDFCQGRPWIHLDIAGTAWTDEPSWEFQEKGATGASVTTLYRLCCLFGEEHTGREK